MELDIFRFYGELTGYLILIQDGPVSPPHLSQYPEARELAEMKLGTFHIM
jgi:hypothetical protein